MIDRWLLARLRGHDDLVQVAAAGVGLALFLRSQTIGPPLVGLGLAGAGLTLVLICAAIQPRAGLFWVVAAAPFFLFPRDLGGQSLTLHEAALLMTALAVGLRALNGRYRVVYVRRLGETPPPSPLPVFDLPIILFLTAALLSLLATEYLRLSLRELRTTILEPVLFWYLCRVVVRGPKDALWLVGGLVASASMVAVVGLGQLAFGGAVTDVQGVRRVLGTYSSPNHFALLLGRALPFLVALTWCVRRWRVWAGVGATLCAGALLATFSVGGWLASGLALLVVVGLLGGRRLLLALVVAGVIAGAVLLFAVPVERLAGRLDPRQGTSFVRVQLWQAAGELVRESPILGIGLDNFLYRYPLVMPPDTPYEPNLSHPHNLILQFWLQLGLAGLAACGWLLWRFWQLIWPWARDGTAGPVPRALAVGALASMIDFVAHGLVDNSYFLPDMAIVFWLTLAVAASLSQSRHEGVR